MTTSGDPHRPGRHRAGAPRPGATGGGRRAAGPQDPAVAGPGLSPGPAPGLSSGLSPGLDPGAVEWGSRVPPSGPAGATAYSADSPDLFPPLPEPAVRRTAPRGATAWARTEDDAAGPPPFAWPDDRPGPPKDADDAEDAEPGPEEAAGASPWPGRPPRRRGAVAATTALVLGAASLLALPLFGLGVLVAVAGLVAGGVGLRGMARGRALAGLALSVLSLAIAASVAAWLASVGVVRCFDESLYPTRDDVEACLAERLGLPVTLG